MNRQFLSQYSVGEGGMKNLVVANASATGQAAVSRHGNVWLVPDWGRDEGYTVKTSHEKFPPFQIFSELVRQFDIATRTPIDGTEDVKQAVEENPALTDAFAYET